MTPLQLNLCRSDLTLVCSPVEMDMLVRHYGVPASKLVLAPFFAPPSPYDQQAAGGAQAAAAAAAGQSSAAEAAAPGQSSTAAAARGGSATCPPFHERRHFVMIGNWRHPPNLDSARWACSELWPALRAALPAGEREHAELHLYGAYAAGAAQQLHRPVGALPWMQAEGGACEGQVLAAFRRSTVCPSSACASTPACACLGSCAWLGAFPLLLPAGLLALNLPALDPFPRPACFHGCRRRVCA